MTVEPYDEQLPPPPPENERSIEIENASRECLSILEGVGVIPGNDGRVQSAALCLQRELGWQALAEKDLQGLDLLNEGLVQSGQAPVSTVEEAIAQGHDPQVWKAAAAARPRQQ